MNNEDEVRSIVGDLYIDDYDISKNTWKFFLIRIAKEFRQNELLEASTIIVLGSLIAVPLLVFLLKHDLQTLRLAILTLTILVVIISIFRCFGTCTSKIMFSTWDRNNLADLLEAFIILYCFGIFLYRLEDLYSHKKTGDFSLNMVQSSYVSEFIYMVLFDNFGRDSKNNQRMYLYNRINRANSSNSTHHIEIKSVNPKTPDFEAKTLELFSIISFLGTYYIIVTVLFKTKFTFFRLGMFTSVKLCYASKEKSLYFYYLNTELFQYATLMLFVSFYIGLLTNKVYLVFTSSRYTRLKKNTMLVFYTLVLLSSFGIAYVLIVLPNVSDDTILLHNLRFPLSISFLVHVVSYVYFYGSWILDLILKPIYNECFPINMNKKYYYKAKRNYDDLFKRKYHAKDAKEVSEKIKMKQKEVDYQNNFTEATQ